MALTLAEAAKLSNDMVLQGIIETIVKESPVLQVMPFIEMTGNTLKYNRENAAATAAFYAVGDAWTESTPTFTQVSTSLAILGGDADVDNYLRQTRSNVQDIEAAVLELKAKAVAHKYEDTFINGDTAVDANSFDGLKKSVDASQTITMGTNGGVLTLDKLDELVDLHKPGKPEMLLMSRRSRRKLSALRRAAGSVLESDTNAFGQRVLYYDGIPIGVNDWISDAETEGTSNDCSSIYALSFGEGAVAGLQNGGIQLERIGSLESKDASRTRVKWYCGLAIFNSLKLARLKGVRV
jgi:HK97 family phage major capsid protein